VNTLDWSLTEKNFSTTQENQQLQDFQVLETLLREGGGGGGTGADRAGRVAAASIPAPARRGATASGSPVGRGAMAFGTAPAGREAAAAVLAPVGRG
jgi:hypothetical protein